MRMWTAILVFLAMMLNYSKNVSAENDCEALQQDLENSGNGEKVGKWNLASRNVL